MASDTARDALQLPPPDEFELDGAVERARTLYVAGTMGSLLREACVTDGLVACETPAITELGPEEQREAYTQAVSFFMKHTVGESIAGSQQQALARSFLGSETSARQKLIRQTFVQNGLPRPFLQGRPVSEVEEEHIITENFVRLKLEKQLRLERQNIIDILSGTAA